MRIGRAGDNENLLRPLADRFVAASVPRAILQAATAAVLMRVLIAR